MMKKYNKNKLPMPMLTMQAAESGLAAVVDITGVIGWEDSQCLAFADQLQAAAKQGAESITLRVNSPGGDVFSALSMYDAIMSCKLPVRAEIHGLAASAASLLVMAADTVAMSESAKLMVHQPMAGVWGSPDEIMNYAQMLMKERERMFAIYGEKCGKPWDQVSKEHQASVYYDAQEAIAYGFVDEVIHEGEDEISGEGEDDGTTADVPAVPVNEEGTDEEDDSEEEDGELTAGMTGTRGRLTAAVGGVFGRVFGRAETEKKDPMKELRAQNMRLSAMNKGLTAQLNKLKSGCQGQEKLVDQLVNKAVTARLSALGLPAEDLPAAAEYETSGQNNALPRSKEEFHALSLEGRIEAIKADPAAMSRFI